MLRPGKLVQQSGPPPIADIVRLLGQVGGLGSAQNLIDEFGGTSEQVIDVWPMGDHAACVDIVRRNVHGWQPRRQRKRIDANTVGIHQRIDADVERVRIPPQGLDRRRNVLGPSDFTLDGIERPSWAATACAIFSSGMSGQTRA